MPKLTLAKIIDSATPQPGPREGSGLDFLTPDRDVHGDRRAFHRTMITRTNHGIHWYKAK